MKSIEEIKARLMMKVLNGSFDAYDDVVDLFREDDLRIFVSNISPCAAYRYAVYVDKCPHEVTRKAACKDPEYAYFYASLVDECVRDDTRKSAYKDPNWKTTYINRLEK